MGPLGCHRHSLPTLLFCFLELYHVWDSRSSADVLLPLGDLNVVVLTDVHSWVGGHGNKEPTLNADYGHVLSFYQRLKDHCMESGRDVWLLNNGDWIDGTGRFVLSFFFAVSWSETPCKL